MSVKEKRLFLTGASGLLGRAIYSKFVQDGWSVFAVAFSRIKEGFHKLDITNENDVKKAIIDFNPSIIVHSAALRYPDQVDKNPEQATVINVDATRYIAEAAVTVGCQLIYISTDYVFDGKAAPYSVEAKPNPVNLYGKTKLEGERVITEITKDYSIILRVPVLYGPVEKLSESAVTVLLEPLLNKSKVTEMSNYERRRPSHVDDIALICLQLATAVIKGDKLNGVFHWCGSEEFTKYDMVMEMSKIFCLDHDHIKPNNSSGLSSSTVRPYNTTLDTSRLVSLGFGHHTPFNHGIERVLTPWIKK